MNIVQIGANIGNDDVTPLVKTYKDKIKNFILVEPLSNHNSKLEQCYSDIPHIIENIAITPNETETEISFYYHIEDVGDHTANFAVASINKTHITLRHGYNESGLQEVKVRCMTLNSLFDKYNLTDIDVLFIDAEGIDDTLIKSIDFSKYNITSIVYENLHINNDPLILFLTEKNYSVQVGYGQHNWSNLAIKIGNENKNICKTL